MRLEVDLLPAFVDYVARRRARNLDTYVACTGREGWGKSALGLTAALAACPNLDPNDVILERSDYYRVYDPDARDQTYVFDEATRLFFNRRWNNKHQVALIQEVIENRQNRNLIFMHLPQFKTLDKYAREGRIDLWFACTAQGVAMVRKLAYNSYTEEAIYPIIVDEHRWVPLEESHPEFARVYYKRKADAHARNFHRRQAKNVEDDDYKDARRDVILSRA